MFRRVLAAGVCAALAALATPVAARGGACHSLEHNRTGPKHCGLLGRRAGSLPDFEYSPAMRASGIVWNESTLDRFLAAPTKTVPGTSMGYAGTEDPRDRADLIAWLSEASKSAACNSTQ
jgi:cytochrome c